MALLPYTSRVTTQRAAAAIAVTAAIAAIAATDGDRRRGPRSAPDGRRASVGDRRRLDDVDVDGVELDELVDDRRSTARTSR